MRFIGLALSVPLLITTCAPPDHAPAPPARALDGAGNNRSHPDWGRAHVAYLRVGPYRYADGGGAMADGPPTRYISNRVFNDTAQNLFSENGVTQWGAVWGQFLDHTFGSRLAGGEDAPITYDPADPLESFANEAGAIPFARSVAAPAVAGRPRDQLNIVGGHIDASAVYGDTAGRMDWLREGTVDGDPTNNAATLLLTNGMLPRRDARGDVATAPVMSLDGALRRNPAGARVAGDERANENVSLLAVQTLFAREHNRIVGLLPATVSEHDKFEIARRIVGAEQQFITYEEFLPAMGVELSRPGGYDERVNAGLANEFATVGFRAHSMIHGEIEAIAEPEVYTPEQIAAIAAAGVGIVTEGDVLEFIIPLNMAFGNPDLLDAIGLDPVLRGLGAEPQYRNDEQMDNQLRSVLFQLPASMDPACLDGPTLPQCYRLVSDLGALDVERGRDHGMGSYNELRVAYGLPPVSSFTEVTGEATDAFPADPEIDPADPLSDPSILDFVSLADAAGNPIELGSAAADAEAVSGVRRTTLAARLAAIYGDVNQLDAFVGMVSEPHLPGSELGELQHAMWRDQFEALRDGDRFFYLYDAELRRIEGRYGITFQHTLGEIIAMNSGAETAGDVFHTAQ